MDHWTGLGLVERLSYDSVWADRTGRTRESRATHDEPTTTKATRRRMRLVPRRAHARTAVGART